MAINSDYYPDKNKFEDKTLNSKHMFDPDLALLPIILAKWDDKLEEAIVFYQNPKSTEKFGGLKGQYLSNMYAELCPKEGLNKYNKLLKNKAISHSGVFKDREVKFHSRVNGDIIQTSISDNTKIFEYRDKVQRSKIIDSFLLLGSHELKTPLNAIMGFSSILQQLEHDEETGELIDLINSSSVKLDEIINKMLKYIYLEDSDENFEEYEVVNVSKSISESYNIIHKYLYDRDFNRDSLELKSKSKTKIPKGFIEDTLTELSINLRRNTPENKKVIIRTYDLEKSIKLEFENEGLGIPPDKMEDIFKPFYLTQEKMHHSSGFEYGKAGMGMGLTIIKRYIDRMGGKIWFENKYEYLEGKDNRVILNIELPIWD